MELSLDPGASWEGGSKEEKRGRESGEGGGGDEGEGG